MGPPIAAPSNRPLMMSLINVFTVVLLKPNRASIEKVEYIEKGSPEIKESTIRVKVKMSPVPMSFNSKERAN